MKKVTLMMIAIVAFVCSAMAQTTPAKTPKSPEQKAENQTKKWTSTLSLTADQVPKVKSIFLDHAQKIDAIKSKYAASTDKKPMHQELKTVRNSEDAALKGVLTPEQYTTYVKTKEEKKANK